MKKIIFATNNQNKVNEVKKLFGGIEIISLAEAGINIDVEEVGTTFEENALIKARTIYDLTKMPTFGDDSGLMVDALDGRPGIYSARYAGVHGDYAANNRKLLAEMSGKENRKAKFVTAVAFVYDKGEFVVEGSAEGEILNSPSGNGGFGYDPIFYSFELKKSFGDATLDEKNSVSHRARAFRKMKQVLIDNHIISDE